MKYALAEATCSAFTLCRFLFWYVAAVTGVLFELPQAAVYLQEQYDALHSVTRLLALVGLFLVVAIWQIRDIYFRSFAKDQADNRKRIQQ